VEYNLKRIFTWKE